MGTLGGQSELQRCIGADAVKALASVFPGQRIYVPWVSDAAMIRFAENFAPLIGANAVARLISDFGGLRILVPTNNPPKYAAGFRGFPPVDMDRVIELTEAGLTASQIAKLLNCNPRTVHATRTKARNLGLLAARFKRKRRKGKR